MEEVAVIATDKPTSTSRNEKMEKMKDFGYPHCRDQSVAYEKLKKIGHGTFGYNIQIS